MSEKEYLLFFDVDARKRHRHLFDGGRIIKFMVQLEVQTGTIWREVLRYDCAHEYVHKDCYNIRGKQRKMRLRLDYEDALTLADEDINLNWQTYRERFLRGEFP
jgi:hypothetical protein